MTTNHPKAATLAAIFALTTFLCGFIASGADTTTPPPGPGPGQGRAGRGLGGPGGGAGPNFQAQRGGNLGLDDQQLQLFREATMKNSDELRKLDEKLRAAQKELVQAAIAEKYDEKAVREKAEAVAKIQIEMATLRANALAKVAPTLKPEQRDQLENSPIGAAMLMGGGMGGGRFGGGPGPGPGNGPPPGRRGQNGQQ